MDATFSIFNQSTRLVYLSPSLSVKISPILPVVILRCFNPSLLIMNPTKTLSSTFLCFSLAILVVPASLNISWSDFFAVLGYCLGRLSTTSQLLLFRFALFAKNSQRERRERERERERERGRETCRQTGRLTYKEEWRTDERKNSCSTMSAGLCH